MIGTNLKQIRQKKKMTQKQVAEQLGVSRQAICLWESNKREVKVTMLKKLSNIFKVSITDFLRVMDNDKRDIKFEITDPDAKKVFVTGDFTRWEKQLPLRRSSSGTWQRRISLEPGRYEYKFIVDGQWRVDPANDLQAYNEVGTLNSVKEI